MIPTIPKTTKAIIVRRAPGREKSFGLLSFGNKTFKCLLGKNGISTNKREGDMTTPAGSFRLLYGYFRKDRLRVPPRELVLKPVLDTDAWCDEPAHPNYNRPVDLPFAHSCEIMKRKDQLYDIVIVMDHNYTNRIRGRGSAVFFHLTDDKHYTAGCVAVPKQVMLKILPNLGSQTVLRILP